MTSPTEPRRAIMPEEETRSAFQEVAVDEDELLQDPTDFSDPVERQKRMNRIKLAAIALGTLLGIILVLFMGSKYAENKAVPTQQASYLASSSASSSTPTLDPKRQPLLAAYPDAPTVTSGEATTALSGSTVTSSEGGKLTVNNSTLTAASTPCKVVQATDFCLAARGKSGDATYDIYYLKDAAHSRLFEAPASFEKTDVRGSSTSGALPLQMGDKSLPTEVVVNKNSSGWMVVFNSGTPEQVKQVIASLTAE